MKVIVIGYGRVGASLANMLADMGHSEVTVVDSDPEVVARISAGFPGRVVHGIGFDEETLRTAGIENCDVLAAVTSSDNVNVMTTEVARRIFNVPRVITRLVNPARLEVYRQLGFDYICDTERVAEDIFAKICSGRSNHLDTVGSYEVLEFAFAAPRQPQTMTVGDLEDLGDISVALINRGEETYKPSRTSILAENDLLVCVVHMKELGLMTKFMKG